MFCYIYEDYFELYVPKRVERIISGESLLNTPQKLFAASWVLIIPALMNFFINTVKTQIKSFIQYNIWHMLLCLNVMDLIKLLG
jgi:hypothetical protein